MDKGAENSKVGYLEADGKSGSYWCPDSVSLGGCSAGQLKALLLIWIKAADVMIQTCKDELKILLWSF